MKVSDYIAQLFVENNMKHIFSISGAGNVHLLDSIQSNKNLISIHPHQEQAGVLACLTYYRLTKKLGVMITTSGGAATNAITGALDAFADSIPVLIISGQEKTSFVKQHTKLRMWGVQGFDIVKTVSNITKYAVYIDDPNKVKFEFQKAIDIALTGRKGPVWIDIPSDILTAQINEKKLLSFIPKDKPILNEIELSKTDKLYKIIEKAKRPVFIFGNGIRLSGGENLLTLFIDKYKIPFLLSWNGLDLLPTNHQNNFGRAGTYGQRCANFVVQNADLIITIGTRLAIPQIGYEIAEFGRDALKYVVDIDIDELNKFKNDESFNLIQLDASEFLQIMLQKKTLNIKIEDWLASCNKWKKKFPFVQPETIHKEQENFLNSYSFINELNKHFKDDEVIVTDMGTALTCTHQAIKINKNQRLLTSTGLGEMGFGLPGAIGASFAINKQRIILINGDGSMMMNLQEMQTIIHHQLPIKLFVYINDAYLTIKHTQKGMFGDRLAGSDKKSGVSCPDFSKIGDAFGFKTFKLSKLENAFETIELVLNSEGPVLCEVFIHPLQILAPKTSFNINSDGTLVSPPLEDLYPFLNREEFKKEMIIDIHPKSLHIKN